MPLVEGMFSLSPFVGLVDTVHSKLSHSSSYIVSGPIESEKKKKYSHRVRPTHRL